MLDEKEQMRRAREADEQNTERRANILGVKYVNLESTENTMPLMKDLITIEDMYKYRIAPLKMDEGLNEVIWGITLSTPQTELKSLMDEAEKKATQVVFWMISDSAFRALMLRFDPPKTVFYDNVEIAGEGDSETIKKVTDELAQVRPDDILDYVILQAYKLGASDIHLENFRENVRIRFRIDGMLHPVATLTHDKYRILFASIASASDISTAADEAQSGHIGRKISEIGGQFKMTGGTQFDKDDTLLNMRVETVPVSYGQDAVIRLFNFDASMLNMDALGMSKEEKDALGEIIERPNGMLMIVGPTGSGKSTTLYSVISKLNDTSRKILTLEDPVEFDVPGVVQVPVDTTHGHNFVHELRTVLRLDPDVVMLGEIRDNDTAKTAIQAAITGHLLLSTFHADDAAAAFARMIDMIGINPIFASAIRMVIGQRLVRRLDQSTAVPYVPSEDERNFIFKGLTGVPSSVIAKELGADFDFANYKLWNPGKSAENPFGYKGRTVIMEIMPVSEEIAAFLAGDSADTSAQKIRETAVRQGMLTMMQKAILKVLRGETTLKEISRVL